MEATIFDLTGRKALITGASGAIGGAIARQLHGAGATVGLSGTRRSALAALGEELGDRHGILTCNLSNRKEVTALVPRAIEVLGGIDILVNNAGITRDGLFMRLGDEDWDAVMAVNVTAAFLLTRAVLKPMMRQRFGRIIGITSVVGVTGNAGQGNYAASKAAMIGMSKALAQEVATRSITVNTIAPGFIESQMTDILNDTQRQAIRDKIPAKRLGTGADVASAVVFLASTESAYITGQTLHVNGGMVMV